MFLVLVVFNLSKIQNLKRFTTIHNSITLSFCCIQSVKDTKFKAIHNPLPLLSSACSCIQSVKDTKFKAIHN